MERKYTTLRVDKIVKETSKAFLIQFLGYLKQMWVPKSQINYPERYAEGDRNSDMSVSTWWLENRST